MAGTVGANLRFWHTGGSSAGLAMVAKQASKAASDPGSKPEAATAAAAARRNQEDRCRPSEERELKWDRRTGELDRARDQDRETEPESGNTVGRRLMVEEGFDSHLVSFDETRRSPPELET